MSPTQKEVSITMYAVRAWDAHLRTVFALPFTPYEDDKSPICLELSGQSRKILAELGVVFYRDQFHAQGLILPAVSPGLPEITAPNMTLDFMPEPLELFKYVAICKYPKISIVTLPVENRRSKDPGSQYAKYGDTARWLFWAEPVKVAKITPSVVQRG